MRIPAINDKILREGSRAAVGMVGNVRLIVDLFCLCKIYKREEVFEKIELL